MHNAQVDVSWIGDDFFLENVCRFERYRSENLMSCLLYTSPSPRDRQKSRMPSSA